MNYSATSVEFNRAYAKPRYPLVPLRRLVTVVQYGTSSLASEEEIGLPILRMNNLQNHGWALSDLKYVQLPENEQESYRLQKGDILFNRTNSKELVGKCEVFREEGHWVFASYLIRVRIDTSQAEPDFVSMFLNTRAGRIQIHRVSRQIIGMSNINAEELRDLLIPLPRLAVQRELVGEMERGRETRRQKLAQADALLSGLDAFVIDRLGLTLPGEPPRTSFALPRREISEERLDAHFYSPPFRKLVGSLTAKAHKPLGEMVRFSSEQVDPANLGSETFRYIEIAGVDRVTGEVTASEVPTSKAPSRARMKVERGDIIVSLTRPHHGSIALLGEEFDGCVASTGFAVIREITEPGLPPWFLLAMLRSRICLQQMLQRSSGGNYPAITEPELRRIVIPLGDKNTRQEIVAEFTRRRLEARRLREDAAREWDAAKARFQACLIGTEPAG